MDYYEDDTTHINDSLVVNQKKLLFADVYKYWTLCHTT